MVEGVTDLDALLHEVQAAKVVALGIDAVRKAIEEGD
jgi:hypothetical protein